MGQRTVFASYSHEDGETVILLVSLMRSVGTDIFKDNDSIPPGTKWRVEILSALEEAEIVLVFWSENSSSSKWVKEEYGRAISLEKRVIPVLMDSTPLIHPLNEYQYIDLRKLWKPKKPSSDTIHLLEKRKHRKAFCTIDIQPKLDVKLIKELLPAALALKSTLGNYIGESDK